MSVGPRRLRRFRQARVWTASGCLPCGRAGSASPPFGRFNRLKMVLSGSSGNIDFKPIPGACEDHTRFCAT